jgi:hypothetical protein
VKLYTETIVYKRECGEKLKLAQESVAYTRRRLRGIQWEVVADCSSSMRIASALGFATSLLQSLPFAFIQRTTATSAFMHKNEIV